MPESKYSEEPYETLSESLLTDTILFITATDIETNQLHQIINPLPGFENIIVVHKGNLTYYSGLIGRYKIVHVQCSMGSLSRDSSIITVTEAINLLNSKVVIMPGIAFGVDDDKQRIGDVLVAEAVQPYNNKRVGIDTEIHRATPLNASKILLNRFKNLKSWEYLLTDNSKAKLLFALVLSGEELIDNKQYRDELLKKYPTAQGGEMEGAGIYAACDGKTNCILIKGICDFADGQKGKNKLANQQVAIESALSVCVDLLNSKTAFKELGVNPIKEFEEQNEFTSVEINETLFEIYDISKEKYYIERSIDLQFNKILNQSGIWVYGVSGCGKSSLIARNLLKSKHPFIQINLASCIDQPIEAYFSEILLEVSNNIEGLQSLPQTKTFPEQVKTLLGLLASKYANEELILFIEEIPLDTNANYQEFAQKIYSLLVSKALIPSLANVRLILSSINDPTIYIQSFNQKIHTQLKFLHLANWTETEIEDLIALINTKFKIGITENLKKEIITKCKMSPRFIKKFFRNALFLNQHDADKLRGALIETERELF